MNGPAPNLLGTYGDWAARELPLEPPPLSFRHPRWPGAAGLEGWKAEARREVRALLRSPYDDEGGRPPAVRVRGRRVLDGVEVEELSWQLPYGPPTEAVLLKPAGSRGRLPGVLGLHDHAGVKYFGKRKIVRTGEGLHPLLVEHQRLYYGGAAWANELARRGFAVLVHDVFPFESRRVRGEDLPPLAARALMARAEDAETVKHERPAAEPSRSWDVPADEPAERIRAYDALAARHEATVARSLLCMGRVFPGVVTGEDLWAFDHLASRPDVDPDRLGCCGLSGGGLRTNYLAGLDDRVRGSVTAGFMTTWRDFALQGAHMHTWMIYIPYLAAKMDHPDILSMRAPLPSLVLATEEDPLFDLAEVRRAAAALREAYGKAGAPDRFRFTLHPGPHQFDRAMQEEAFAWLERWLKS